MSFRNGRRRKLWWIPLIIIGLAAKAAVVMYLWNWLIPDLFHGPVVNYCQAIGLMILGKVLMLGGGHKHWHGKHGIGHGMHGDHLGKNFFCRMSDEDREKLRAELDQKEGQKGDR